MAAKDTIVNKVFKTMGFRHNMTVETIAKHSKLTKEQVYGAITKLVAEGSVTKHDGQTAQFYRRMEKSRPVRTYSKEDTMAEKKAEVKKLVEVMHQPVQKVEAPATTDGMLEKMSLVASLDKLLTAAGEIETWYKNGHVVEEDRKKMADLEARLRAKTEKVQKYEAKIYQLEKELKEKTAGADALCEELEMIRTGLAILTQGRPEK